MRVDLVPVSGKLQVRRTHHQGRFIFMFVLIAGTVQILATATTAHERPPKIEEALQKIEQGHHKMAYDQGKKVLGGKEPTPQALVNFIYRSTSSHDCRLAEFALMNLYSSRRPSVNLRSLFIAATNPKEPTWKRRTCAAVSLHFGDNTIRSSLWEYAKKRVNASTQNILKETETAEIFTYMVRVRNSEAIEILYKLFAHDQLIQYGFDLLRNVTPEDKLVDESKIPSKALAWLKQQTIETQSVKPEEKVAGPGGLTQRLTEEGKTELVIVNRTDEEAGEDARERRAHKVLNLVAILSGPASDQLLRDFAIKDKSSSIRQIAVKQLIRRPRDENIKVILQLATDDSDQGVRFICNEFLRAFKK